MYAAAELFAGVLTAMVVVAGAHLRYQIEEGVPRGTVVGSVVDDAQLRSRYSAADLAAMRFRFLVSGGGGGGGGGPGLFEVGAASGVIRTATVIDRDDEELCRRRRRCELSVDVITQPVQLFQIIKVRPPSHRSLYDICPLLDMCSPHTCPLPRKSP